MGSLVPTLDELHARRFEEHRSTSNVLERERVSADG